MVVMAKPSIRQLAALLVLVAGSPAGAQECYAPLIPSVNTASFAEPDPVFDTARSRFTVVDTNRINRTLLWDWTGTSWTVINQLGPLSRSKSASAYDSARGRLVVYGGVTASQAYPPEVWEWDGQPIWAIHPSPPGFLGRSGHAMTYDAARQRTLVFGGRVGGVLSNETAVWDGSTWAVLSPSVRPPPRVDADMVYDSVRERVLLMGGGGMPQEVWEWDGTNWAQRPSGPPFTTHSIAYNPTRGRVLFIGGSSQTGAQAWEFDGGAGAWSLVVQFGPGFSAVGQPAVFDGSSQRVSLCGQIGVTVWNDAGSTIPPWFITQPQGGSYAPGANVVIEVAAGGNNLGYQWLHASQPVVNGGHISGAQSSQLRFTPFTEGDAGEYRVVVSNACTAGTSNSAFLASTTPCGSPCYANCDGSTNCPVLTANDFACYLAAYVNAQSYANCDNSGGLTHGDFICFLTAYNSGCS
jgi:hypothetical protein